MTADLHSLRAQRAVACESVFCWPASTKYIHSTNVLSGSTHTHYRARKGHLPGQDWAIARSSLFEPSF